MSAIATNPALMRQVAQVAQKLQLACTCGDGSGSCKAVQDILNNLLRAVDKNDMALMNRFFSELTGKLESALQSPKQTEIFNRNPEQLSLIQDFIPLISPMLPSGSPIVNLLTTMINSFPKPDVPDRAEPLKQISGLLPTEPAPVVATPLAEKLQVLSSPPRNVAAEELTLPGGKRIDILTVDLPKLSPNAKSNEQPTVLVLAQNSPPPHEPLPPTKSITLHSQELPSQFTPEKSIPKALLAQIIVAAQKAPEALPALAKEIVSTALTKQPETLPKVVAAIIQQIAQADLKPELLLKNFGELAKAITTVVAEKAPEQLPQIVATMIQTAKEAVTQSTMILQLHHDTPVETAKPKAPSAMNAQPIPTAVETAALTPQKIVAQILDHVAPVILAKAPDQLSEVLHVVAQTVKNTPELRAALPTPRSTPISTTTSLAKEPLLRTPFHADTIVQTVKADRATAPPVHSHYQGGVAESKMPTAETTTKPATVPAQTRLEVETQASPIQSPVLSHPSRAPLTVEIKTAVLETIKSITTQPPDQIPAALVKLTQVLLKAAPTELPTILPKMMAKAEAHLEFHAPQNDGPSLSRAPQSKSPPAITTTAGHHGVQDQAQPLSSKSAALHLSTSQTNSTTLPATEFAKPPLEFTGSQNILQHAVSQVITTVAQRAPQHLPAMLQAILTPLPPLSQAAMIISLVAALPPAKTSPVSTTLLNVLRVLSPEITSFSNKLPASVSEALPQLLSTLGKVIGTQQAGQFLQAIMQLPTAQSVKILQLLVTLSSPSLVSLGNILNQLSPTQIVQLTQLLASLPKAVAEVLINVLGKLDSQTIGKVLTLMEALPPHAQEGLITLLAKLPPTEIKGLLAKLELLAPHEIEAFLATILAGENENDRIKKRRKLEQDQALITQANYLGSQADLLTQWGLDRLSELARYRRQKVEETLTSRP